MSEKPDMELAVTYDDGYVTFDRGGATFVTASGSSMSLNIEDMRELSIAVRSWNMWRDRSEDDNTW